jgi:hypothetical protein
MRAGIWVNDYDLRASTGPGSELVYKVLNRLGFPDQIEGWFSAVEKLMDRSSSLARMTN